MPTIFISYSRRDSEWRDQIVKHLEVLGTSVATTVWDDRRIGGGVDYRDAIADALLDAEVAVLLVSASFLTSPFIVDSELPAMFAQELQGRTTIVPFLVDHCVWQAQSWLERRNIRPTPSRPASDFSNREEPLARLAREVWLLLRRNRLRSAVPTGGTSSRISTELTRIEDQLRNCWDIAAQPVRIEAEMRRADTEARAEIVRRRERRPTRISGTKPGSAPASFKDRLVERSMIGKLLADSDTRVVQVVGRGGMGKTALACRVLRDIERGIWPQGGEGPDVLGIVYLSTRTRGVTLDRIYGECLAVLPIEERPGVERIWSEPTACVEDKIDRLFEAMRDGLYLVLLDDLEDILDAEGKLQDPGLELLLAKAMSLERGPRFLLTSRRLVAMNRAGNAIKHVPLTAGLPTPDASDLVRELLESDGAPDPPWSPAEVARIAERFHGVPRALELAAGALLNDPLLTVDQFLSDAECDTSQISESVIRVLAEQTYSRIDPDGLHVMQALAIFGRPVLPVAADFLLRPHFPGIDVPGIVRRLCRTHLASADRQSQRVALHPIDRDFLYYTMSASGDHGRHAMHRTAAEYYVSRQVVEPLTWQDIAELDPYIYEFEHLLRARDPDGAARKLGTFANWLTWRGFPERTRALLAEVPGALVDPMARLTYELASCANMTVLGPISGAVAHGRRALRLARTLGDDALQAQSHWRTALAYRYAVQPTRRAVHHFREAVTANVAAGTEERNPWVLCELCITFCYQHKLTAAVSAARQAQIILSSPVGERLDDGQRHEVMAHVLQALGFALCLNGDMDGAIEASERSIELWTERRQPAQICAYALHVMALAHAFKAAYDRARDLWQEALDLARAQGQPRPEGICNFNLALLTYLDGDRVAALEHAHNAVTALARLQNSQAAETLVDWLRGSDTDPASTAELLYSCAKASWQWPDLFGYHLFRQWAADAGRSAKSERH